MGRRNKLQKFEEILAFPNVYENADTDDITNLYLTDGPQSKLKMKGHWNTKYFKNKRPIVLELACGKGEYTLALAQQYPEKNFIGVDIKGARIWQGARFAIEEELTNVAFLRTRIEMITNFFEEQEVSEIWITFPDPFLKDSKSDRRLTSHPFLKRYQKILQPEGFIHLKTDDDTLYNYSMETLGESSLVDILYNNDDIYATQLVFQELEYKTYYEQKHLKHNKTIKYIRSVLK